MSVGVVVVLVIAAVVVVRARSGDKSLRVTLLALDARPTDAFADSVVTVKAATARDFAKKRAGGASVRRTLRGDTKGLYGSSTASIADPAGLAGQLTGARGAAWAKTMGIAPGRIGATLGSLTPLLVSHDLVVTDHGYSASGPVERPVVLEAGTAVGVDHFGRPVVDLGTGDPLTPVAGGVDQQLEFTGDRWPGFDDTGVVGVEATDTPVEHLGTVDIVSGEAATTPVGGTVSLDGYLVSDNTGVSVVSLDGGTTTKVIDHPVARVYDDGAGGLIWQESFTGAQLPPNEYQSPTAGPASLTGRRPIDEDQARIWRLRAGASDPEALFDTGDWSSKWPTLQGVATAGASRLVLFSWRTPAEFGPNEPDASLFDLASGRSGPVASDPRWADEPPHLVLDAGGSIVLIRERPGTTTAYRLGDDGKPGPVVCTGSTDMFYELPCSEIAGITGDGKLVVGQEDWSSYSATMAVAEPGSGRVIRQLPGSDFALCRDVCPTWDFDSDVAGDRMIWSNLTYDGDRIDRAVVREFDLANGTSKDLGFDGPVRFLRAPLIRPAGSGSPAATTSVPGTAAPPSSAAATPPPPTVPPTTMPASPTCPTFQEMLQIQQAGPPFGDAVVTSAGPYEVRCEGNFATSSIDVDDTGDFDYTAVAVAIYENGAWHSVERSDVCDGQVPSGTEFHHWACEVS